MAAMPVCLNFVVGPIQMLKLYGIPYWVPDAVTIFVMWLDFVTYLHHHGHEDKLPWYRGKNVEPAIRESIGDDELSSESRGEFLEVGGGVLFVVVVIRTSELSENTPPSNLIGEEIVGKKKGTMEVRYSESNGYEGVDDIQRGQGFPEHRYPASQTRLVLLGDEASLRSIVDHIRVSVDGAFPVLLIGVDMEDDSEEAFYVAVQKAWTCLGSLDAFINCYTYQGKMQDILQVPEGEFKKITKINLTAPWYLLKAVASTMKEHGAGGSIVFLATIASGERGLYPGADAYATAAAGIHQLVRVNIFLHFLICKACHVIDNLVQVLIKVFFSKFRIYVM
ncbi:unnamed protein product [Eruca vesicaria subsp. sativa]|uniref:Uncharacterized protein n=1 Tax=Eruca vesicaria subsp. sativa TaxID=29727 RepID=A0ABC8IUQ2_ERUVS|nr:unnamed protein product [Eruca vesicaria subsp. sativa]